MAASLTAGGRGCLKHINAHLKGETFFSLFLRLPHIFIRNILKACVSYKEPRLQAKTKIGLINSLSKRK